MINETQISWDLESDELRAAEVMTTFETEDRGPGTRYFLTRKDLGRVVIRLIGEAHKLTALVAAKRVIDGGLAPENFTLSTVLETVQPKIGDRENIFPVAAEMGTLAYHQLAEACALDFMRSARNCPMDGGRYAIDPQLSGIAVPITVVGVAALAALAWWGSERSEDMAAVEVEKAWAVARAYAEVQVAQAEIAAGRKPKLSDWGSMRLRTAQMQTAGWFPYAAIGLGAVLLGGAAYFAKGSALPSRQNPRRKAPRLEPARRRRRKNPKSLRMSPPEARRENPTRAEFIGEARSGGASPAQAARLWKGYLAAQRSRSGRRGGKARARRRNPAAAKIRAPRVLRGRAGSPVTSSAPSSPKRAPKRAAAPKRRAPSVKRASPKPAKRAKPIAKRSARRAPRAVKSSGRKRAKR